MIHAQAQQSQGISMALWLRTSAANIAISGGPWDLSLSDARLFLKIIGVPGGQSGGLGQ
jgi:hypothetical protein